MQAVIMAGGKGTRLTSITKNEIPKPMVPVAGKPLLLWQLETLRRSGITDVVMVIGYLGQKIEEYFADGAAYGVNITYIREEVPLGTAGSLRHLKKLLTVPYFLLVFGDVFFEVDTERMERFHLSHQAKATLFVHPNDHPQDSDLIVLDACDRAVRFISKHDSRDESFENCVNAGLYILDRSLCELAEREQKMDLERDILAPLIERAEDVYGYRSIEYIKDIGTRERILQVEKDIRNRISCR